MPPSVRIHVGADRPALRDGLRSLLAGEADLELAAAVEEADVVLLDHAPGRPGVLSACFALKQRPWAPAVVLYSAAADGVFAAPAAVAQADGMVSKSAPADELLGVLRQAGLGGLRLPRPDAETAAAAWARLRAEDVPVAGMLAAGAPVDEVAGALRLSVADVRARAFRILGRLDCGPPPGRDG